ncbi:MAG: PSD1 and planctomycete cytochrome C domain-containing protein [Pirellulaceae bacterium]
MLRLLTLGVMVTMTLLPALVGKTAEADRGQAEFFENKIRPLLSKHCYECHSEAAGEQQGGLLLDREAGWLKGGERDKAVVPGQPDASLLIKAVRYTDEDLQMPPEYQLAEAEVRLLEQWIRRGAAGPLQDLGATEFSRLGDQEFLFAEAKDHWAFEPVVAVEPPEAGDVQWNQSDIDRFVFARLAENDLEPSRGADPRTLLRRLRYDLTGLPPTAEEVEAFVAAADKHRPTAIREAVDRLLDSPAFGEHIGRMWLDVARYADTDSFYRPDTRTPHYFPFAFTYRDYVVEAFNSDKPFDQFLREQLAADLMGFPDDAPEIAALGFLAVGPHANRDAQEALDDWIDVTTRGLMGLTVACARCHDHKFEPIPTADYYSLRGVFASINRPHPLKEDQLPVLAAYQPSQEDVADYEKKRAAIEEKIVEAGKKTKGGNKKSVAKEIQETDLAELLLFHPGAPAHAMIVTERGRPVPQPIYVRGDPGNRGETVPRRFLKVLDPQQSEFSPDNSGRLDYADKIASPENPLTARVFVNRVWGHLLGSHLVDTPSDFGLQGSQPTHPQLLDWLAEDFVSHGWSTKRLVRQIVLSRTYAQSSAYREDAAGIDPENRLLWRANRKHLSIEAIRDSLLSVAGRLDPTPRGRAAELWGENYTRRRAIYGYVNRFNLDPTLRVFDFPTPMQSQPSRGESIVAPQALFTMNSPFVVDQAMAICESDEFTSRETDAERAQVLFRIIFQRDAAPPEVTRIGKLVEQQGRFFTEPLKNKNAKFQSPWPLVAQALLMSNEFQYID